jgi:general secretion pathway protein K
VKHSQSGIALLTALFVVALATIAAVALVSSSAIAVRRAETLTDSEQAEWYASSIESWVCSLLLEDAKSRGQNQNYDSLGDLWAQPVPYLPLDNRGVARGQIVDLQGLFNLNNLGVLSPQEALAQFQRLLQNIPGMDPEAIGTLGPAIRDWLDSDADPSPGGGAEDDYYLSLDPPYRAANRFFASPSELLAVKGVTPAIYTALRPYVTALPTSTATINLNTAPLPVLASLSDSPTNWQAFIEERTKDPLTSLADAAKHNLFSNHPAPSRYAGVSTSYFQLRAQVTVGTAQITLYSTIHRTNGATAPVVISHSFGAD